MKKLHQLFIFLSITSSAFCLSADTKTESTKASTLLFLATLGTRTGQRIQIELPKTESDRSGLFMSLTAYEPGSSQRLDIPYFEENFSKHHGISPLGSPEPKEHGVSPVGIESPRK